MEPAELRLAEPTLELHLITGHANLPRINYLMGEITCAVG